MSRITPNMSQVRPMALKRKKGWGNPNFIYPKSNCFIYPKAMLISPEAHLEETEPKPGMNSPIYYQKSQADNHHGI